MIKKSIRGLVLLGGDFLYLRNQVEGNFITDETEHGGKYMYAKRAIESFFNLLEEYEMPVTLRAADELREFFDKIKHREIGTRFSKAEAAELRNIIVSLEKTFWAEVAGIHSFFTTDKKILIDKLTSDCEMLFPEGIFGELSEIAKYDVKEAGMCIAFERSTAAAFHILRATEDILRMLYCCCVKRGRVKVLTWGNITKDLEKKRKKPSNGIMKNLDYIRSNFRNPTIHPEVRHDIEEAQSLFILSIDVISKMIKDPLWKQ